MFDMRVTPSCSWQNSLFFLQRKVLYRLLQGGLSHRGNVEWRACRVLWRTHRCAGYRGSHKRELSIGKEKREGPGAALIFGFWPAQHRRAGEKREKGISHLKLCLTKAKAPGRNMRVLRVPSPPPPPYPGSRFSLKFTPIKTFPQS